MEDPQLLDLKLTENGIHSLILKLTENGMHSLMVSPPSLPTENLPRPVVQSTVIGETPTGYKPSEDIRDMSLLTGTYYLPFFPLHTGRPLNSWCLRV